MTTIATRVLLRPRSLREFAVRLSLPTRFALLAAALAAIGTWVPSASQDEGATTTAVDRTLPQLGQMVFGTVDAVHGLYYAAAHVWALVFGQDLIALRFFSVLGVAVAAAGTVRLGQLIDGNRLGLLAGCAFLTVPMITWTATEARSYAWVIAGTVWATVLLLRALTSGGRWWLGYAVEAAVTSTLFVYSALAIACHVLLIVLLARGTRARLLGLVAWLAAMAAVVPVAAVGYRQRAQVDWIGPFSPDMLRQAVLQWFGDSQPYATVAWSLLAAGIVVAIARLARRSAGIERRPATTMLALIVPWLLVPTVLLLAATAAGRPSYVPRYGAVSVGAVAILVGYAASRIAPKGWTVLVLLAALSLPVFVAQRLPLANGNDWAASAAVVGAWSRPGDTFYFAKTGAASDPRQMLSSYPQDFRGLGDLALWTSAAKSDSLFDSVAPAADAIAQSHVPQRVIVVADNVAPWWGSGDQTAFTAAGYTAVDSVKNVTTTVLLLVRQ